VAGGTSVLVGIGTDADPNKWAQTATLTKNSKTTQVTTIPVKLTADEAIEAFPLASGGGIGNTQFSAGVLRVRIVYDINVDLDNAV
jgi:hypothetical protein